jgi:hypothetical protein
MGPAGRIVEVVPSLTREGTMFEQTMCMAAAISVSVTIGGCSYNPPPFPVHAVPAEARAQLAGKWYGEFTSWGSSDRGSIIFEMDVASDSARGDVLFEHRDPFAEYSYQQQGVGGTTELVRIRFMRYEDPRVLLVLEPFYESDCDCMVSTGFQGVLKDDAIVGEYFTGDMTEREGTWEVRRRVEERAEKAAP